MIDRPNFRTQGGLTFSFYMTDHLNYQFTQNQILRKSAQRLQTRINKSSQFGPDYSEATVLC